MDAMVPTLLVHLPRNLSAGGMEAQPGATVGVNGMGFGKGRRACGQGRDPRHG